MPKRPSRYRQMERYMTAVLIADGAVFLLFLLSSGFGWTAVKVLTAIVTVLCSGLCLVFLYLTREILRPRSLWMTVAAGAILVCVLLSLALRFPCPAPKAPQALAGIAGI